MKKHILLILVLFSFNSFSQTMKEKYLALNNPKVTGDAEFYFNPSSSNDGVAFTGNIHWELSSFGGLMLGGKFTAEMTGNVLMIGGKSYSKGEVGPDFDKVKPYTKGDDSWNQKATLTYSIYSNNRLVCTIPVTSHNYMDYNYFDNLKKVISQDEIYGLFVNGCEIKISLGSTHVDFAGIGDAKYAIQNKERIEKQEAEKVKLQKQEDEKNKLQQDARQKLESDKEKGVNSKNESQQITNESTKPDTNSGNNNNISQQEQEKIIREKKAQEESEKEKALIENEKRKKEYADNVIRESNAQLERDKAAAAALSKTTSDFAQSVLSEKDAMLGVSYGFGPEGASYFGVTMGNKTKYTSYFNFGGMIDKTFILFCSMEIGRFNLLRLIPNYQKLNETISLTPSIGYYSISTNLEGKKPENRREELDYDAFQLGISFIINASNTLFFKINYCTDASYFKGFSGGTVGPVIGKSSPFNGAQYINVGMGFGFGS